MDYQEIIDKLQHDSVYFSKLKPQQQLFVANYCSNGFEADPAAKACGAKSSSAYMRSDVINKAIEEFMKFVLADKAIKLESMIIDVLWRRSFYNVMDFIDEEGQPRFDVSNYKEELGANAVVIDGIKPYVHAKNQDYHWVEVQLADRNRALKELSNYIGLAKGEDEGQQQAFTVNIAVKGDTPKQEFVVQEYKKQSMY